MFKQTATDLTTVSPESFEKWLNSFDIVLSDVDGVQWISNELLDGSREVTNRLQELGKDVYFVTNSPLKSQSELQEIAKIRGYNIPTDHMITASYVTAKYLHDQNFNKKVYLMGSAGISTEFKKFGIKYIDSDLEGLKADNFISVFTDGLELDKEVGAVVLSYDMKFSFAKLLVASNYLKDPNCLFIATSEDLVYPLQNGIIFPALGPLIAAIEKVSGRKVTALGKPHSTTSSLLHGNKIYDPKRTLMIGDSLKFDIEFSANCGFQSMFVNSGLNKIDDILKFQESNVEDDKKCIPDVYLQKLGDLLPLLNRLKHNDKKVPI